MHCYAYHVSLTLIKALAIIAIIPPVEILDEKREDARQLMQLCEGGGIDKTRYLGKCPDGKHVCEVDEFYGDNQGLVAAEIELGDVNEAYQGPDFLGPEVTGNAYFRNSHLLSCPYRLWKTNVPDDYQH